MNSPQAAASARQRVQDRISAVLQRAFLRNSRYYYDQYYGTDHGFVLGVKNLVRPTRLMTKLLYGQLMPLPSLLSLATAVESIPLDSQGEGYLHTLRRDGIVFIPGYFAAEAQVLSERYRLNPLAFPATDKYMRFNVELTDREVLRTATDLKLLGILARYYRSQPYLRQMPTVNCTHPDSEKARESAGFNNFWHYDTANQVTAHVLLNDCMIADSCMFYAKSTHRTHRVNLAKTDYYYSEAYVRDHFQIVPCVGKAGTLVIFDPNGLHRVDLKQGTFRAHLHLNFVPGNNIIKTTGAPPASSGSPANIALNGLTSVQRTSLAHLTTRAAVDNEPKVAR